MSIPKTKKTPTNEDKLVNDPQLNTTTINRNTKLSHCSYKWRQVLQHESILSRITSVSVWGVHICRYTHTPLDKNKRPPSKIKKKILFIIFKL